MPHWMRDETAGSELAYTLCAMSFPSMRFVYEGASRIFLNLSPLEGVDSSIAAFESLGLTENDVVLENTRSPLDDTEKKKRLRATGSKLEQEILFPALRRCFRYCSREEVQLQESMVGGLGPRYKDRSDIKFSERRDLSSLATGTYESTGPKTGLEHPFNKLMTAGYVVNLPLGKGLPNLLSIFGMSGSNTLAVSHMLTQHPEILTNALQRPSFTMLEIQTKPIPYEPVALRFCDSWTMEMIGYCLL